MNKKIILILSFFVLVSCQSTVERLKRVGKDPELANIDLQELEEDEEDAERNEARMDAHHAYMQKTNSLWQPGSTKFFRDSRAWRIGDIITVIVQIQDQASLNNETNQKRNGKDTLGIPNFFGKEKSLSTAFSSQGDNNNLIGINSSRIQSGGGNINRKEAISTAVAATVTKILPSGNLVIQGRQEIRVNGELREVKVGGIIRPKDITTDNSIQTNQIAEARISYGGRGVVSDVQQPRVGSQVLDIISPF
jgi:flagellar L-ring protein precursor FlgH